MKQMTCTQMGGSCSAVITGETAEDMAQNGMVHVLEAHPDMAEQIKAMTPEETSKWMEEFSAKFESAEEVSE